MIESIKRQRFLNFLGIAQRAGKIISGENVLLKKLPSHHVRFLVLAADAGRSTAHKFRNKAQYYRIPLNQLFSRASLCHAIGRQRTVMGIANSGFATRLIELNQEIKGQ